MKNLLVALIAIIAVTGLVVWRIVEKTDADAALKKTQQARAHAPSNVVTATAGPQLIQRTLSLVGTLSSPNSAKLSPQTTGRIDFLQVREGDFVHAGQVLVRIDPTEIQGEALAAQAAVAEAEQRLAQAQLTENPTNVQVSTQIQTQEAGVKSAQANFNQTKESYDSQVAAAHSAVVDAQAKVASADSAIKSASAGVNSAEANLADAQVKLARVQSLYEQQYAAAQDVDDAKATAKVAEAALESAKQNLAGAKSGLNSAKAEQAAAEDQESITKTKGKADIAAAQASLDQSRAALKYAGSNKAQIAAYKANLAALQAGVDAAKGQLSQAQAKLVQANLVSPMDGYVTQRAMDPGTVATAGTTILEIDSLQWLFLTANVPIEDSSHIHVGQQITAQTDSFPGETFDGTIEKVNPAADPTSRQFTVYVRMNNPAARLRPGMYMTVSIVIGSTNAPVAVPLEAISTVNSQQVVFVVDSNNIAHQKAVQIGLTDSKYDQVSSGIQAGDKVVILSYLPLKDGQKVTEGAKK